MRVEICKQCGTANDPAEMVDGVCWACIEHDEPLDFDNLYQKIDNEITDQGA
jgi:hypothetical protein